jgi:hypothetical protein
MVLDKHPFYYIIAFVTVLLCHLANFLQKIQKIVATCECAFLDVELCEMDIVEKIGLVADGWSRTMSHDFERVLQFGPMK